MFEEAYYVAGNMYTRYESKGHVGYEIYEDDKIEISLDTYYLNLSVYVKKDGERHLVLLRSGHGNNQEYHHGAWEKYIVDVLYPLAQVAKQKRDEARALKEAEEYKKNYGDVPEDLNKIFKES